jgi:hypothetical protein
MKKLLVLPIIFLSLMMSSVVHAKWTKLGKGQDGDTYYMDFERIKKHDGKVYFWRLADYLKPTKTGSFSSKVYVEAECGRFRLRYLNATFYKGPKGEGTVSTSINIPEKDWHYPPPDSVAEALLKVACNHKP